MAQFGANSQPNRPPAPANVKGAEPAKFMRIRIRWRYKEDQWASGKIRGFCRIQQKRKERTQAHILKLSTKPQTIAKPIISPNPPKDVTNSHCFNVSERIFRVFATRAQGIFSSTADWTRKNRLPIPTNDVSRKSKSLANYEL